MKLNKYIGLAAMAVAFTACQQDMLEGEILQNGIYTLNGEMAGGAAMSRAQVELGNTDGSKETFMWNDGDAFALYQDMVPHVFTISSDYDEINASNKKSASFTTDNPASAAKYIAIYPASVEVADDNSAKFNLQKSINFNGADTQAKQNGVWRNYLKNNMFMMAKGTLVEGAANVVSFEHLCAMARISYTNQTNASQNIGFIRLGGEQIYKDSKSYTLKDDYENSSGGSNPYMVTTPGLTVAAGATTDFYILFFPSEFGTRLDITLNIDSNARTASMDIADIAAANSGAEGFEAGKRYWFKVTGTDNALVWTKNYSADVVTIKNVGFARALDWYFNKEGKGDGITLDENGYAIIDKELVESTTYLWTGDSDRKNTFTTLEGIEHFVNLQIIKSAYGALEECDFSKNKYLKEVYLQNNNLKSLDFSGNTGLEVLYCVNNRNLTSVNLSRNQHLKDVSVSSTGLSSLTIPNPAKVEVLRCSNLNLNTLGVDFAQFTALKQLELSNSKYDVASLPTALKNQLTSLTCSANGYISLELSEFTSLTSLICSANNLTSLALPDIALKTLYCDQNKLGALDLSKLTTLESLMCGNQQTGTLVLTLNDAQKEKWNSTWKANCNNVILEGEVLENVTIENAELSAALQAVLGAENVKINSDGYAVMTKSFVESVTELNFSKTGLTITSLKGIEKFVNLDILNASRVGLEECDLSKNLNLTSVAVYGNKLTSLDVSKNTALMDVNCAQNYDLTELNISSCTKLKYLIIDDCELSSIVIPNPENIFQLAYSRTNLTIDFTKFTSLKVLYCDGLKLTSLDMPSNIKKQLIHLTCVNNNIKSLNLSEYPNLQDLDCQANLIETLDATPLTKLKKIACGNQQKSIVLKLQLTDAQKTLWNDDWSKLKSNTNVELSTAPSVEPGNGNTGGSDFTIEGIY